MVSLDQDQDVASKAFDGNVVVIAGPGSGKTTVLVRRYVNMITSGIFSTDILNLTFTAEAAKNMVERVGIFNAKEVFRTFHSFALDLIMKEKHNLPFPTSDFILPTYGQDVQLIKDLVKMYPAIKSYRSLREYITNCKAANVTPEQALEDATDKDFFCAAAYRDYEVKCRQQGWLDFDSMMRETVKLLEDRPDVKERWQRKYICVDECQDTDTVQFRLLQLLYKGNIFVVGDENQCQPPGTIVDVLASPRKGRTESHVEQVAIEDLSETNDKLVSWDPKGKRVRLGSGRRFRRAARHYDGKLIEIHSNGNTTRVTPNHFLWVKFNREALAKKTHFVYLMWRKDLGFRVGTSTLRTASGSNQISHRGYQERADKMWILDVVESGKEARIREEIYSLVYQIPERIFQDADARRVFDTVSTVGGFRLLREQGLGFNYPLVSWDKRQKHQTKFHGYFKTAAANIIEGLMDLPTEEDYKSAVVEKVKKMEYSGPVYSLEVEKDHTYVADGIPVGNCIYEWRSAVAGNLSNFSSHFPGSRTLYLGANYRSTGAIVEFLRRILPVDNGIGGHMRSMREFGEKPKFIAYNSDIDEANAILGKLENLNDAVVIARTNRQLRTFQKCAMAKGIKTTILGQKDLWQTTEVKHLLDLTKKHAHPTENAYDAMNRLMQSHNLTHVYSNTGGPNEKPPVENLNDIIKLSAKRGTVKEFAGWLHRLTWACQAAKSPSYDRREENPTLALTTVHQAKGREWKHVFVVGAKQGMMPHTNGEINEEKRIFFVACSRAADRLEISFDANRSEFLHPFSAEIEDKRSQIVGGTELWESKQSLPLPAPRKREKNAEAVFAGID